MQKKIHSGNKKGGDKAVGWKEILRNRPSIYCRNSLRLWWSKQCAQTSSRSDVHCSFSWKNIFYVIFVKNKKLFGEEMLISLTTDSKKERGDEGWTKKMKLPLTSQLCLGIIFIWITKWQTLLYFWVIIWLECFIQLMQ